MRLNASTSDYSASIIKKLYQTQRISNTSFGMGYAHINLLTFQGGSYGKQQSR